MSVAVAQFWPDWTSIAVVVGIFLFGQFLEGNVLCPSWSARTSACIRSG